MKPDIPSPGSPEAIEAGCKCTKHWKQLVDNRYRRTRTSVNDCPLHGDKKEEAQK